MNPANKPLSPFESEAIDLSLELTARAASLAVQALSMGLDRAAVIEVAGMSYDDALAAREKLLVAVHAEVGKAVSP